MKNFSIQNKGDFDEIDIIGDIGESWFSEGHTMDSVRAELKTLSSKNLVINISSLGGDVNHALAIHDMIKMHSANVTAKITGFTASSGTIISMAADTVEMSDNALFLVHNAWTGVMGNQHDLREVADDLAKVDERIINIYMKKTGKSSEEVHDLMKEEKWIDGTEAKEFGFVDAIFEPVSMAASLNKVLDSDLPQIPERIINKIENMNIKEEFDSFKASITDTIEEIKNKLSKDDKVEVTLLDNEEVTNKITEIEDKVSEMVDTLQDKEEELTTVNNSLSIANAKIEELTASLDKVNAVVTVVEGNDPDLTETPVNEWETVANLVKTKI